MEKTRFGIRNFDTYIENPYEQRLIRDQEHNQVVVINKFHIKKLLGLSRTGLKLLDYFINNSNPNADKVYFDLKQCIKYTGYNNKRSIYNALTELLEEQIIARTKKENIYYLNADIIKTGAEGQTYHY